MLAALLRWLLILGALYVIVSRCVCGEEDVPGRGAGPHPTPTERAGRAAERERGNAFRERARVRLSPLPTLTLPRSSLFHFSLLGLAITALCRTRKFSLAVQSLGLLSASGVRLELAKV